MSGGRASTPQVWKVIWPLVWTQVLESENDLKTEVTKHFVLSSNGSCQVRPCNACSSCIRPMMQLSYQSGDKFSPWGQSCQCAVLVVSIVVARTRLQQLVFSFYRVCSFFSHKRGTWFCWRPTQTWVPVSKTVECPHVRLIDETGRQNWFHRLYISIESTVPHFSLAVGPALDLNYEHPEISGLAEGGVGLPPSWKEVSRAWSSNEYQLEDLGATGRIW